MDDFQKGEERESIHNDVATPEKHSAPSEKLVTRKYVHNKKHAPNRKHALN